MKRSYNRKGILGNDVETDRELLRKETSSSSFRGDISFVASEHPPDEKLYQRLRDICASGAIEINGTGGGESLTLDKGRCFLCARCQEVPPKVLAIQSHFARPVTSGSDLIIAQAPGTIAKDALPGYEEVGRILSEKIKKTLGRSLAVREVDAGSCNGCEVEISALTNPIYDIERFGIHIVASPRHADVLLVTGVGSRNMELALRRTYEATPDPKIVVAVGACACTGGLFGDTYATSGGVSRIVPVDVFVPGCPPRPDALINGLLLAVDRISRA
jgi:Ni,Fe-hydrogenase III small subunit